MSNKAKILALEEIPLLTTDYAWMRDTNPKAIPIIYRRVKAVTTLSICLSFFAIGVVILLGLTALYKSYPPDYLPRISTKHINNSMDQPGTQDLLHIEDDHIFKNETS